jgi:hypothetical protein
MPFSTKERMRSETTTAATTLPPGGVGRGDVLDASNAHAGTGERAEGGLGTGAGGLGAVTTSGPDLDVEGRDAELLAAGSCCSQWPVHYCVCGVVLGYAPTSWAANMAAYGEDSSRSALTFMPPVTREMVSRPDRSVMWTKVSLKDAKMRATPKTSSPWMLSVCALAGVNSQFSPRGPGGPAGCSPAHRARPSSWEAC